MKTFKLIPAAFSNLKKQLLLTTLPIYLIIGSILVFLFFPQDSSSGSGTLYLLIPLFIFIIGFSLFNTISRQRKAWNSYRLIITPTYILREQDHHSPIRIAKEEITAIEQNSKVFHVRTANRYHSIFIPKEIENKEEVEGLLKSFMEISAASSAKKWQFIQIGYILGALLLFYGCFLASSPLLSLVSGLILFGGLGYSLFVTLKAKQLESRVRVMAFIGFIPLTLVALKVFASLIELIG